jgi:hypothetical protein
MPAELSSSTPPRPLVYLVFGVIGLLFLTLFSVRGAHMLGPSGDSRVAVFDLLGMLLSLVPSWGLIRYARPRPLREAKGWFFGALLSLVWLGPLLVFIRH